MGLFRRHLAVRALAGALLCAGGCGEATRDAPAPIDVEAVLGEPGVHPGQFDYPRAMDAHDGMLVVIDKSARVQVIDPESGDCLGGWRMPAWKLGKPTGVTVAPHPLEPGEVAIWVPDTHYHRVAVYDWPELDGRIREPDDDDYPEPVVEFGEYGAEGGQFIYTTDVAVIPGDDTRAGRVYVSEYGGNDRVSIFEREGDSFAFVRAFGTLGSGEDPAAIEFNRPQSIEINLGRGELVITDSCNHRVGRFTLEGELIAWIGSPASAGEGLGSFRFPYGLALLRGGEALVAEFGNCRVQRIDLETGAGLGIRGEPGRSAGQLATPWAVEVIGRDAFVLDSGNSRVLRFRSPTRAMAGGRP
jgi:hypothetical protein